MKYTFKLTVYDTNDVVEKLLLVIRMSKVDHRNKVLPHYF